MTSLLVLVGALGALFLYQGLTGSGTPHPMEGKVTRRLQQSGISRRAAVRWFGISVGTAVLCILLFAGLTSSLVVALPFGIAAGFAPWTLLTSKIRKRSLLQQEEWPDALASLMAAVRSGSSLPEAMVSAGTRCGPQLESIFDAFTRAYHSSGSFAVAMEAFRREAADPVADRLAVVLTMTQEVGGTDLVRVLRTLGDFVRSDLNLRKEIAARWSWTVSAARLAAAAPWLVLAMMATQPEAARAFSSPAGAWVITFGGAATLLGYRLMLRAGRLPSPERLAP